MRSFVLAATLSAVVAEPVDDAWDAFKLQFPKSYNDDAEEIARKNIFAENFEFIQTHNAKGEFQVGVNQFADLTNEEFAATYTGRKPPRDGDTATLGGVQPRTDLADSIDWTTMGAVTPIKDQGQCGSCWSFSATGGVEGSYQIASGRLVSLAEQQLVDCDTSGGCAGCNGGWEDKGIAYIGQAGGCEESSYPYTATDGTCKLSQCQMAVAPGTVSGVLTVDASDAGWMSALNSGPVSIAIKANGLGFQLYKSGVMTGSCGLFGQLDHAVLAVGYGTDSDGTFFYKVKNSWGTSWGEAGYFKISSGALCTFKDTVAQAVVSASVSV